MMKRLLIMLMVMLLSVTCIASPLIELTNMAPSCCCESNCDCDHPESDAPIFRNIKCGDNSSGTPFLFSSDTMVSLTSTDANQSFFPKTTPLFQTALMHDHEIEPLVPPPQLIG
jgi:hypothetical protein